MIAVIQRCSQGKVTISDKVVGEISNGLVILLGVQKNDTEKDKKNEQNQEKSIKK